MLLFKILKGLFNNRAAAESIIDTQIYAYNKEKQYAPDKDPHFWLAEIFRRRYPQADEIIARSSTLLYSCIDEPDNVRALGLYFLYKERKDLIRQFPEYAQDYENLMSNIINIQESQPEKFEDMYNSKNPVSSNIL